LLFAIGLFGASTLAAFILPLSSAYAVCEAFGFETGLNKKFSEAPIFYGLYTVLIVISAGVILIPKIPLVFMMILAQVIQGLLLPVILIFMALLINNKRLMGVHSNSRTYNITVWLTISVLVAFAILLIGSSLWSLIFK